MSLSSKPIIALTDRFESGSTVLFVSPHYDDVVFSCAGLLYGLVAKGVRVFWATVFSHGEHPPSGFALECQTAKGIPKEVDYMALRRLEDERCAEFLGIEETFDLGFHEAPHRGYSSVKQLFGYTSHSDKLLTVPMVSREIDQLAGRLATGFVIAPLGLGNHVDHILVSLAAKQAISPPRLIFYLDSPYLLDNCQKGIKEKTADMEMQIVDVSKIEDVRATAYAFYQSQLGFQLRNIGSVSDLARKSARHAGKLCKNPRDLEIYFGLSAR